jgi:hypothetical protein
MATDIPGFPLQWLDYKVNLFNGTVFIPHIAAPTVNLADGMLWTQTTGLFARINGATVGPFLASAAPITGWTPSLNTASPNNSVNVARWLANTSSTDGDACLSPKGTGAIIGQIPDNGVAGGTKRGHSAVDFQTVRSTATSVASGLQSVLVGGIENTAAGDQSIVVGGVGNQALTAGAFIGGGNLNVTSGQYSFIGCGAQNSASGGGAAVVAGQRNTADGDVSWSPGGQDATARGMSGAGFYSSGKIAAQGDSQQRLAILRAQTTTTGAIRATTDGTSAGSSNQFALPNNSAYMIRGDVVARSTTGNVKSWEIRATVKRGATAGTTAIVGTAIVTVADADAGAAAWTVAVVADTVNGAVGLNVTGAAATTINWVASLGTVEVAS